MTFDFDKVIDRRGTNCLKYDFAVERGRKEDILPLWVADMDFQTAPGIQERLRAAVDHGIFGYSDGKADYFAAVSSWYREKFGWETKEEWLIKTPGVVFALATAVRAFTEKGDRVLIQQPVYYPFSEVIRDNGRVLINSPLKQVNGRYEMDFEDMERKITENQVKLFLLCSPHNPVGRVWTEEELKKAGELCVKHGVLVVSDEIHSDFTYPGVAHHVFAGLSPEFARISVTCTAPSKTFNIAGLQVSNIFIPDPELRARFQKAVDAVGYSQVNLLGLLACQAAYETGEEWLSAVKEYIYGNLCFLREYLKENLPEIRLVEPEGTYLVWLDFGALGLTEEQRQELIEEKAGLWLDSGAMFGPDGEGFERVNIACPRETLQKALDQLAAAVRNC
ncbi:MalY/PatB family protein [Fusibacillus kribbianus]|uniref:cysteine-S-conjugate beta-lyase n=1 Tax=Fusibacillus kribbianus TaxID=3044208 RepID=A0AAP4EXJ3_9FIRM|nr:MalY/PatB family protein [Ruminococcus sp. YH-rum2234]MDI9241872.1 MalY/PatB family protein [Ruminococcus sp. YH-rum2234]